MIYMWLFLKGVISTESIVIAIVGYVVVFTSLLLLFWLFSMLPKLISMRMHRKKGSKGEFPAQKEGQEISGETTAAISMALHLFYSELHDEESGVLTIKKVSKSYSPWSSKIYAVRNQFNRR